MRTTTPDELRGDRWLDAAPFGALLRFVMAAGRVSAADLAALTGLPVRLLHHLAHGRHGRPVRRVSPHVGSVLMQLQPDQVRLLHTSNVPAGLARCKIQRLQEAGWTTAEVMWAIGASPVEEESIAQIGGRCSQLLLIRLRALCRELDVDQALDLELALIGDAA